jgi:hypothetical protein
LRCDDAGRFCGVVDDDFLLLDRGCFSVDEDVVRLNIFLVSMSPMIVFCVYFLSPMIRPI